MNKVILMERLTREPEVRYSNGAEPLAVARYTLAVNRRFKRKDEPGCTAKKDAGGEADFAKQSAERADFIPCVAFGKSGEFAEKYFKKGQMVSIVGRLQVRSWEDNEGKKRWTTEVIVEEQYFAESKKDSGEGKPAAQSKPAAQTGKQMGLAEQKGFYPIDESVEDDDLPF